MHQDPLVEIEEEEEGRLAHQNYKRFASGKQGWRKSFYQLKKSRSERKIRKFGKNRESMDGGMKTHREQAKNDLVPKGNQGGKKRPGSAGTGQSKPLDIAKMNASLRLLKKSIDKSNKSNSSSKQNTPEILIQESSRGPIVPKINKEIEIDSSIFKRKGDKSSAKKPREKVMPIHFGSSYNSDQKEKTKEYNSNRNSPCISRMRRIFGSEKVVRKQFHRNNSINNQSSSLRDSKMGDQLKSVETSEVDESIFERSTYENFIDKKYQELYKQKISEYDDVTQTLEKEAEKKRNRFKRLYNEKKISSHSYDRELEGVEKWKINQKKEIKKNWKNIAQIIGHLQKDQFDLQKFKQSILSPDESRLNTRNISSIMADDSVDSINLNKIEMLEFQ